MLTGSFVPVRKSDLSECKCACSPCSVCGALQKAIACAAGMRGEGELLNGAELGSLAVTPRVTVTNPIFSVSHPWVISACVIKVTISF